MRAQLKATIFRQHGRLQKTMWQRRRLKDQVRHRDAMIVKLHAQIRELQAITKPQPVFNCVYPTQMMALAVYIILHGGSLRCAAATAGFYAEMMGWPYSAPSWKSASNWVQRCGLHALKLTHGLKGRLSNLLLFARAGFELREKVCPHNVTLKYDQQNNRAGTPQSYDTQA